MYRIPANAGVKAAATGGGEAAFSGLVQPQRQWFLWLRLCPPIMAQFLTGPNIRGPSASRGPRLHDFRHRFAVQTLLRWHHTGEDVRRRLPILSTYLGHGHVTDTYWYVTGTPELMAAVGQRLDKRWEGI
jgi:hypothetical protein